VKVNIPAAPLTKCRELVQEFRKSKSEFKEMGGYLIGTYDGDFTITEFLLDTNAESTGIRIKLSAECYHEVEEKLKTQSSLSYVGTWHIHPGKSKPTYSQTDRSTLFLEKLVIKTDNPKEFRCPRIHLIFSEDLTQISAYTLHVNLEYDYYDLWNADKNIQDSDITKTDEIINRLQRVKKEFQHFKKEQKLKVLENCYYELGEVRREIDELIDNTEEISDFQEMLQLITKEKRNIESRIKSKLKSGDRIGILVKNGEQQTDLLDYRPNLMTQYQENSELIGFWKHYSQDDPSIEFQEIFFTNFFVKTGEDYLTTYIYILSSPSNIAFFALHFSEFSGISFDEVEILLEEMP